jgi:uncharacterized protein (DUF1778 family)
MATVTTGIRFTIEEKTVIQKYAEAHQQNFSDIVRQAVLEKIEDEYDLAILMKAIAEDDGTHYSLDEVDAMFSER